MKSENVSAALSSVTGETLRDGLVLVVSGDSEGAFFQAAVFSGVTAEGPRLPVKRLAEVQAERPRFSA